ncbi:MAG: LysR family transcriptional regulator [Rhodospirillales bacterium]|nr:LysR family transcriptional regulator [Rhodospirillales bacterium]
MDLRRLRYFVEVVEARSMSAAAMRLHVAQPALSKTIQALEEELGAPLLQRSARGVAMTEAGELLYEHSQIILGQVERARHEVQTSRDRPSGHVVIGMPYSVTVVLGMPLVQAVSRDHPELHLELAQDHSHLLTGRLRSGRLDLAVMAAQRGGSGQSTSTLLREKLVFVDRVRPGVPRGRPVSLKDVAGRRFILPALGNGLRAAAEAYFRTRSLRLELAHEVDGIALILQCISAGLGVSLLPRGCIAADMQGSDLDLRPMDAGCVRTIVLCRADAGPVRPAVLRAEAVLRNVVAELVAEGRWPGGILA